MYTKLGDNSFINFVNGFDFVCFTETFMDVNFDYKQVFHDFVKYFAPAKKLSKQGRNSGGVLLLVKNSLSPFVKEIKLDNTNNMIAILIDKKVFNADKDVVLVACYIPPEGSPVYNNLEIKDGILILEENILQSFSKDNVHMIVCGDLNARTGEVQPEEEDIARGFIHNGVESDDEDDDNVDDDVESTLTDTCLHKRKSKDKTINSFGKSLLDFCFLFNLCLMNGSCASDPEGEFTFVSFQGSSVIDYFLVSRELCNNCDFKVLDEVFSWHLPVTLTCFNNYAKTDTLPSNLLDNYKVEERIIWSDENIDAYKTELNSVNFVEKINKANQLVLTDLQACTEEFEKAMYGAAACMIRSVGRKKKMFNEWFDGECKTKKRVVKAALQRFRRAKLLNEKTEKKRVYVKERREYSNLIKDKKKSFDEKRIKRLKESVNDPKLFWKTIRSVNRKNVIYNEVSIRQWHDHFANVFNLYEDETEENDVRDDNMLDANIDEPLFNDFITKDEVLESIKKSKIGKSAGPDRMISEMLKYSNVYVVDFLLQLFNHLFDNGLFPVEWSKSIIIPIYKKGDKNNPDNYRGVALTSVVSKAYTYILNKRLTKWAEREQKIIEEQAGFRATYSTMDHIFTLYSLVQKFLTRNSKLYVAFVDFRKAFDSVNRNILWHTLRKAGVNGKLYRALRGIYDSVLMCVRDKGQYSEYFNCKRGLKQGCLLSPQMFAFFINELGLEMAKNGRHGIQLIPGAIEIFMMLFADDIILLSCTAVGLQNQLNVLKREADRLQLTVNLDKTNIIVFRMGGYLSLREKWWYGALEVKVTNAYKYLGMIFTTKLSLNSGWEETCRKGKRGVIEILRSMRRLNSIDLSLYWKLFDTQIEPVLTYAAEIWGLEQNIQMERVHTYAIKRFLNVPIHASNSIMYGDTGRLPLYIRTYVKCIRYWLRLTKLQRERLCRQAYDMLYNQDEIGNTNWVSSVKRILSVNGFGIVWLSQGVGDDKAFLLALKDRLIACFKQNWHSKIEESDKYSWFFSFKSVFQPERYLQTLTKKWYRDTLTRFRTRTLGLRANKVWFEQSINNRNCVLCLDQTEIEDENHFLFKCKAYEGIRNNSALFGNSNTDLVKLLQSNDENIIFQLAKFISEAIVIRKQKMEDLG